MDYFDRTLLRFLMSSKIKMEITGFDKEGLSKAMHWEMRHRLDMIEAIVYEEESRMSSAEKLETIKQLFVQDFYDRG